MSDKDLKKKLLESEAVTSLTTELHVSELLLKLGWSVSQGSFFTDPVTKKAREIDVVARQQWRTAGPEQLRASLNLIFEVKTMRGYHLLFAIMPDKASTKHTIVEREWIGYASERGPHRTQLWEVFECVELKSNETHSIFKQFDELAYPVELMAPASLIPTPPPTHLLSSAFRETNIGSSKDIEASVFWKSAQALDNYVEYVRADYLAKLHEDVELAADYARNYEEDVVEAVVGELSNSIRELELFNPVVVVDAMLWAVDGAGLQRLPWCRFCQLNRHGGVTRWYDVVQREFLHEYLLEVTDHYSQQMTEADAEQIQIQLTGGIRQNK